MKIRVVGAGPAGLYFAALMKRADPSHDIALFERGPRDATWGFGVVFSDRALEFLRADDEDLFLFRLQHPDCKFRIWVKGDVAHRQADAVRVAG